MKTMATLFGCAICIVSLTLAPAHAALIAAAAPDCNKNSANTLMDPDAIDCSGAWVGNDANQTADVLAQLADDFGGGPWIFADKFDIEDPPNDPGPFIESVVGLETGKITFTFPIVGEFAIALKADDQFSLYLFDGGIAGIDSIQYVTDGVAENPANGNPLELSHASLYVPEPSSLTLLAFCVLGICGVKRRRTL